MFTIQQIKEVYAKVNSGKDFPAFIQDIAKLGVLSYETYVSDGHTMYYGKDGFKTSSDPKYATITIGKRSKIPEFAYGLKEHQLGKTDYMTFCRMSAETGVEKWVVDTAKMTCIYYDKVGTEMLKEIIPVL